MKKDLKTYLENRLEINAKRRIISAVILVLSPTLFAIPVPISQETVLWFVAIILTPVFCLLGLFINLNLKKNLRGILKAVKDKKITSVEPTIYHLKVLGGTVKQTQFSIQTVSKEKYFITVPEKEGAALYEALAEIRDQQIYGLVK